MKFYLKLGVACFDMVTKSYTRLQVTLQFIRYNKSPESECEKQRKMVPDTVYSQSVSIVIGKDRCFANTLIYSDY